jgi:hypothetical protein
MFDTTAGRDEILRRRMERNELTAIQACEAYVEAQKKFAEAGNGYSQRIAGRVGEKDGLYWLGAQTKDASPLKKLVDQSKSDGYLMEGVRAPLHGYYFKILTKQGPAGNGGAKDYVVNGKMTGGFALVAYPGVYRRLGVMTFVVSHDGHVFKKDLSWQTVRLAERMTAFNPDASWIKVNPKSSP